jgi:hypothetical protein
MSLPAGEYPTTDSLLLLTNSQAGGHLTPIILLFSSITPNQDSSLPCTALSKVTLRLTLSQPVSLGVEPHVGLMTRYLLLFDSYGLVFVRRPF